MSIKLKFYNELTFIFNYSNYKLIPIYSYSLHNHDMASKL